VTTSGTHDFLDAQGIHSQPINKLQQGRPNVEDAIKNGQIHLVINTGSGDTSSKDGYVIRRTALKFGIPYVTTTAGALAASKAVAALKAHALGVRCVQEYQEYHGVGTGMKDGTRNWMCTVSIAYVRNRSRSRFRPRMKCVRAENRIEMERLKC
jgi:hypothetical protein